ncbi:MAG: RNA polymerase sigma factor [Acidobacteriaceae bacterium]|nr:RNA polymerase sigma factor [Acidobacteriaceae bacterium]
MIGVITDYLKGEVRTATTVSDFGAWMASEQRRVFLLCRRLLQDPDEADSATQDVFLKAYKALAKSSAAARDLDSPDKWVTRIAVNTCLDRLRSKAWKMWQRRPGAEDEELILEMTPGTAPDPERQLFAREIQQRLETALGKLSERQRVVFSLRHYESMPLDEIATVLKLDLGTVKAHLFRAVSKLREELRDLYIARGGGVRREA